ncbi:MAG: SDR family NAD(P)-dependent oxidoreductase, partial [Candidatus Hodarchaeales archaeon]
MKLLLMHLFSVETKFKNVGLKINFGVCLLMKTTEKVALVTGATKGIGKAICNKLIELDMNLIITAR